MNEQIKNIALNVVQLLLERGYTLSTAESCTGGSIAAAITSIAGCSAVFKGSVVSYSNDVKAAVLDVDISTLAACGAVSEETVKQMACGVQQLMNVDCAVATSGVAGPGGGTPEKPVGTVWMAVAVGNRVWTRLFRLVDKGREANIEQAVCEALKFLTACIVELKRV